MMNVNKSPIEDNRLSFIKNILPGLKQRIEADKNCKPKKNRARRHYYRELVKINPSFKALIIKEVEALTKNHPKHPARKAVLKKKKIVPVQSVVNQNYARFHIPHADEITFMNQAMDHRSKGDTNKAKKLYNKVIESLETDLVSGAVSFQASGGAPMLARVREEGSKLLVKAYLILITIFTEERQFESAERYGNKIINSDVGRKNILSMAMIYQQLGIMNRQRGQYKKAISYYEKAISYLEKTYPNNEHLLDMYLNIGIAYKYDKQIDLTKKYHKKCLGMTQAYKKGTEKYLDICHAIGVLNLEEGNGPEALKYFSEVLSVISAGVKLESDKLAKIYFNVGGYYFHLDDSFNSLSGALHFYEQSKKYADKNPMKNQSLLAQVHDQLAKISIDDLSYRALRDENIRNIVRSKNPVDAKFISKIASQEQKQRLKKIIERKVKTISFYSHGGLEAPVIFKGMPDLPLPNFVLLTGKNGAGKSQLLQYINAISTEKELSVIYKSGDDNLFFSKHSGPGISGNLENALKEYNSRVSVAADRLYKSLNTSLFFEAEEEKVKSLLTYYNKANGLNITQQEFSKTVYPQDPSKVEVFSENLMRDYAKHSFVSSSPLDEINRTFKSYNFPYKIEYKAADLSQEKKMVLTKNGAEVTSNQLSSGEKTIFNVISWLFQYNSKSNRLKTDILILDEPDSHLHPEYIRIFLKILVNEFKKRDIQVILSTHRFDTVSLAPENSIYCIKEGKQGKRSVSKTTKALAKLRLAENTPELALPVTVYTEDISDAKFYGLVDELLLRTLPRSKYSRRYRPNFQSTSILSGGGGGVKRVILATSQSISSNLQGLTFSKYPQEMSLPFGILDSDGDSNSSMGVLEESLSVFDGETDKAKQNIVRWQHKNASFVKLLSAAAASKKKSKKLKRSIGENERKIEASLEGLSKIAKKKALLEQHIVIINRHSLESYLYDPFFLCSLFDKKTISSIQNKESKKGLLVCKESYDEDSNGLSAATIEKFKQYMDSAAPSTGKVYLTKKIFYSNKYIDVIYPESFLKIRGHDLEAKIQSKQINNNFILSKFQEKIAEGGYDEICLPQDLEQVMLELNQRLRAQGKKAGKPYANLSELRKSQVTEEDYSASDSEAEDAAPFFESLFFSPGVKSMSPADEGQASTSSSSSGFFPKPLLKPKASTSSENSCGG